jgi:hypothetical protein
MRSTRFRIERNRALFASAVVALLVPCSAAMAEQVVLKCQIQTALTISTNGQVANKYHAEDTLHIVIDGSRFTKSSESNNSTVEGRVITTPNSYALIFDGQGGLPGYTLDFMQTSISRVSGQYRSDFSFSGVYNGDTLHTLETGSCEREDVKPKF